MTVHGGQSSAAFVRQSRIYVYFIPTICYNVLKTFIGGEFMTKKRIHFIYSIVLSIALVVAGICLMAACLGIYRSGPQPFSPESVAKAFSPIAPAVYVSIALVIGSFLLNLFLPLEKKKLAVEKQYPVILERLHSKLDFNGCDKNIRKQILSKQKSRKIHQHISLALLLICSAVFLAYGVYSSSFHQSEINSSILKAMALFFPCLAIPFGYSLFTAYFCKKSILKEIDLAKEAIAEGHTQAPAEKIEKKSCDKGITALRWALLVVAIGVAVFGFVSGGTEDVLTKAINICTECVGLG